MSVGDAESQGPERDHQRLKQPPAHRSKAHAQSTLLNGTHHQGDRDTVHTVGRIPGVSQGSQDSSSGGDLPHVFPTQMMADIDILHKAGKQGCINNS